MLALALARQLETEMDGALAIVSLSARGFVVLWALRERQVASSSGPSRSAPDPPSVELDFAAGRVQRREEPVGSQPARPDAPTQSATRRFGMRAK